MLPVSGSATPGLGLLGHCPATRGLARGGLARRGLSDPVLRAAVFLAGRRLATFLAVVLRAVVFLAARRLAVRFAGALRAVVFLAVVLRAAVFFAGRRLATFLAVVLRAVVFLAGAFRAVAFLATRLRVVFLAVAFLAVAFFAAIATVSSLVLSDARWSLRHPEDRRSSSSALLHQMQLTGLDRAHALPPGSAPRGRRPQPIHRRTATSRGARPHGDAVQLALRRSSRRVPTVIDRLLRRKDHREVHSVDTPMSSICDLERRPLFVCTMQREACYLGRTGTASVFSGARRSTLVLGPTRSGKTSSLLVPNVLLARSAVVTTSTKDDVLVATSRARSRRARAPLRPERHGVVPTGRHQGRLVAHRRRDQSGTPRCTPPTRWWTPRACGPGARVRTTGPSGRGRCSPPCSTPPPSRGAGSRTSRGGSTSARAGAARGPGPPHRGRPTPPRPRSAGCSRPTAASCRGSGRRPPGCSRRWRTDAARAAAAAPPLDVGRFLDGANTLARGLPVAPPGRDRAAHRRHARRARPRHLRAPRRRCVAPARARRARERRAAARRCRPS